MLAVSADTACDEAIAEIPVRNVWYLLLYAWDLVSWKDQWKGDVEASPHLLGLLAKILAETTSLLMRKQLRRAYEPHHEKVRGIKGRIDFATSLKRRTFEKGEAHCSFYNLTVDTLKNSIIRSTIRRLANDPRVYHHHATKDADLKHQLKSLDFALEEVSVKRIESSDFSRLQLTRNDHDYSLPISICYLVHMLEMPTEDSGDHALKALLRDEITFHKLFELFVCNFYRYHLIGCEIGYQKQLNWFDELNSPFVPVMQSDITLEWPDPPRRLVIDTKYYRKTLVSSPYGGLKFKSENLYQIYTYLRTQEHRGASFSNAQGMLLYPTTNHQLSESMLVQGHKITVATVDLADTWEKIEDRLINLTQM